MTTLEPIGRDAVPAVSIRLRGVAVLAALAGLAGVAAATLTAVALVTDGRDADREAARTQAAEAARVAALLVRDDTTRLPLLNSVGRIVLVVDPAATAALVLDGLGAAPAGRTYQAWVARTPRSAPVSAALFAADDAVVPLRWKVPRGASVSVTLEPEGGSRRPSREPVLVVRRPAS